MQTESGPTSKRAVAAARLPRRLIVVADCSLVVDAITIGLRKSEDFTLLGCVTAGTAQVRSVADAEFDVALVDDLECSVEVLDLVREIKNRRPDAVVIVLTSSMEPRWIDAVFNAGATGAISKATHPAALATLVRETTDGHVVHVHGSTAAARLSAAGAEAAARLPLTPRELEVFQLLPSGATNLEIARKLRVTEQTVKFHLSNVYRKLNVANRTEAIRHAHINGLFGQ